MNVTLFALLEQVLRPSENLRFTISKQSDGRLLLLLQPVLRKKAEDIPKEAEQTRAVLAMPLRLVGYAADLDTSFAERIQGYGQLRGELHDSYRVLLDALKEANKDARNKTGQAGKSSVLKPNRAAAGTAGQPAPARPAPISKTTATSTSTSDAPGPDGASTPSPDASPNTGMMQPMSLL